MKWHNCGHWCGEDDLVQFNKVPSQAHDKAGDVTALHKTQTHPNYTEHPKKNPLFCGTQTGKIHLDTLITPELVLH